MESGPICKNIRTNTEGNQAYREYLYSRVADLLDKSIKIDAIDAACIHTEQDLQNKQKALEYLSNELPPEQLF